MLMITHSAHHDIFKCLFFVHLMVQKSKIFDLQWTKLQICYFEDDKAWMFNQQITHPITRRTSPRSFNNIFWGWFFCCFSAAMMKYRDTFRFCISAAFHTNSLLLSSLGVSLSNSASVWQHRCINLCKSLLELSVEEKQNKIRVCGWDVTSLFGCWKNDLSIAFSHLSTLCWSRGWNLRD